MDLFPAAFGRSLGRRTASMRRWSSMAPAGTAPGRSRCRPTSPRCRRPTPRPQLRQGEEVFQALAVRQAHGQTLERLADAPPHGGALLAGAVAVGPTGPTQGMVAADTARATPALGRRGFISLRPLRPGRAYHATSIGGQPWPGGSPSSRRLRDGARFYHFGSAKELIRSGRRSSREVSMAERQEYSPVSPMCSQASGETWASSSSGTDWPRPRRTATAFSR